jgi:hypothetical protein
MQEEDGRRGARHFPAWKFGISAIRRLPAARRGRTPTLGCRRGRPALGHLRPGRWRAAGGAQLEPGAGWGGEERSEENRAGAAEVRDSELQRTQAEGAARRRAHEEAQRVAAGQEGQLARKRDAASGERFTQARRIDLDDLHQRVADAAALVEGVEVDLGAQRRRLSRTRRCGEPAAGGCVCRRADGQGVEQSRAVQLDAHGHPRPLAGCRQRHRQDGEREASPFLPADEQSGGVGRQPARAQRPQRRRLLGLHGGTRRQSQHEQVQEPSAQSL